MGDEPMIFNAAMRSVVDAAIRDECTFRDWEIVELAVRTNHVHVVVLYAHVACEDMSQKLKARATRWLREKRLIGARRRVWADGRGSCKHLWTIQDVADTALYVRDYQDEDRSG